MATTEEDWERLFRQRLEHYESEPAEDALERILRGAKPPLVEKPAGNFGRRFGLSVALLAILGVLTVSIWQYQTSSADVLDKSPTVAKVEAINETAQATVSPESRLIPGKVNTLKPSEHRLSPKKQRLAQAKTVAQPLAALPTPDRMLEVDEPVTFAGASPKLRRKPDLTESEPILIKRQATSDKAVSDRKNTAIETQNETDGINFTIKQATRVNRKETEFAKPELVFNSIAGKSIRLRVPVATLPAVNSPSNDLAPVIEPEHQKARPSFFASAMPLYTFRQVTPMRQDDVVMEKIRPATSFSARTGLRIQAGAEWPLNRVFSLRVGAVYQKLQQQMTYSSRALRSDSSKVEWVDQQTIKLTPLYKSEEHHVKTTWQYVALSAEGRLRLNPGPTTGLRHSIAAGGSVGYLVGGRSKQRWQPFLQASYGIERRLSENVWLQVEPGIVYNLNAINDNSRCFSVRPYSYGLVIGLHWQL